MEERTLDGLIDQLAEQIRICERFNATIKYLMSTNGFQSITIKNSDIKKIDDNVMLVETRSAKNGTVTYKLMKK